MHLIISLGQQTRNKDIT